MVTGPRYRRSWRGVFTLLVALLVIGPASASAPPLSRLETQRIEFLTAERALREGELDRFRRLRDALRSYPLYPYLQRAGLRRLPPAARRAAARQFLLDYAGTPLAVRLRRESLRDLAKRARWKAFLGVFRATKNAELRCLRLRAWLETGEVEKAFTGVEELWLVPRSQNDACDPVFAAWRKAGRMTERHVWDRIRLAMNAGEPGLVRYLARFLPAEEKRWADLWREVRRQPSLVTSRRRFAGDHPLAEEILTSGLERLAFRDPERAAEAWKILRRRRAFSPAATAKVNAQVGLALARRQEAGAVRWLRAVPAEFSTDAVNEWRIFSAFRSGDWEQGLEFIERLEPDARREERWVYWAARALGSTGRGDEARPLFLQLAGERDYYGFLAADRLGLRRQLNDRPLAFPAKELDALARTGSFKRARELYALGRGVDSQREWNHLISGFSESDLARAAKLAQRQGWHGRAILTLGRTRWLDDVELRFPIAYRDSVVAEAAARRLSPAWVLAIIRQESAFIPGARSPKGALGLMQIMPGTGRTIARSLKVQLTDKRQLLDTDLSIRFGSRYLRSLLDGLFSHPVLATAAYNAGPNRVRRWLPRQEEVPADLWIETVPFTETRRYLRRVFFATAIYDQRLGGDRLSLQDRFRPIPGRAMQVSDGSGPRPRAAARPPAWASPEPPVGLMRP